MELLQKLVIAVGIFSFFTFVVLFGRLPGLRKTPIGWLQILLVDTIPRLFNYVDQATTGGRSVEALIALRDYLFYTRNPIVMIIFLFILTAAASMFLYNTYSQLSRAQLLPIPLLLGLPYYFTFLCATHQSHYITSSNLDHQLRRYPYDYVLYHPSQICRTCAIPKPARSKHCSLCDHCVAKCDHHCPWVNNCLGRGNYEWFLALLISLPLLQMYGAWLGFSLLRPYLEFRALAGLSIVSFDYWSMLGRILISATNRGGLSIAGVAILAGTTAPLPLALLTYHLYLVWAGTTTNENAKWGYLGEDMDDGLVWKGRWSQVRAHREQTGKSDATNQPMADWPVSSDQIVVRTTDGQAPRGAEDLYEQIWSLRHVDNIYDLGFWDNLMEILRGS